MSRRSIVLWSVVVLGAVALVAIVIMRATSSGQPQATDVPEYANEEFRTVSLERDIPVTATTRAGIAIALDSVLTGAAVGDSTELSELAANRIQLLANPDFEQWLEAARRYAPSTGLLPDGDEDAEFAKRWEVGADCLEGFKTSIDGLQAREIDDPYEFPKDRQEPGSLILSAAQPRDGGAAYPVLSGANLEAVEILVPADLESREGLDVPVTLGLRFVRDGPLADWQPAAMFIYLDYRGFGHSFFAPPF